MKSESTVFDYDFSGGPRLNCRMVPYGPQSYGIGLDPYSYRNNSMSAYQFPINPVKSYYSFGDYEENVEYSLQGSYQMLPTEHLGMPNYTTSASRGWATPTPQLTKNPLFVDQPDSVYNHGQLPYHSGPSFALRPAISPEPKSLSLQGLTASLPTQLPGTDRLLPNPAAKRQPQGSFLRTSDSLLPASQPGYQSYHGLTSANVLNNLKNHSNATPHDPQMAMSSSSSEQPTSSQMTYNSGQNMSPQSQMYHPAHPGSYFISSGETSESPYIHTPPSKGSQSSEGGHTGGSSPPQSGGSLVNGQHYVPSPYTSSIYPGPTIEVQSSAPSRDPSTSVPAV